MATPRRPFGHGRPTTRQREAWEAVEAHGSQTAAAGALGLSQGSLQSRMAGYQHAMGLIGPLPGSKPYTGRVAKGHGRIAELKAEVESRDRRIAELERDLEAAREMADISRERIDALTLLAHPWVDVHRKLDLLIARPSGPAVVTHRRKADGGIGGRAERKGRAA